MSFSITLIGAVFIFLFEEQYLSPYIIDDLGASSPYKDDPVMDHSEEDRKWHLRKIIPLWSFIAKIGISISFQNVYICSYSDDMIFPIIKRATAIGICNFVARSLTILSPIVAELDKPIPIIVLFSVTLVALITSFFLPSRQDEI